MDAKDVLKMAGVLIDGLDVIQGIAKATGIDPPVALDAIDKIIERLRDGLDGKTAPEIVARQLSQFRSKLAATDASIDQAIADHFAKKD
jgi:hypothetical protein